MILSIDQILLVQYVRRQLDQFFPDNLPTDEIEAYIDDVLDRIVYCFSAINDKYYTKDSQTYFNHLNSDHYAMFLYFLSNTLYRNGADVRLCEKIFYLNKMLHGIDVFYSVELPEIFLFVHPLGTVLGRAKYSDYFLVYQNCTIGGNHDIYPVLGKHVSVYNKASIIGNCKIGDNCKIATNSLILDYDLIDDKIYIGTPNNCIIKKNRNPVHEWK